ncbi:hypothetical protein [Effusibacillus dendaii]|uniref:Uncharacterized protein n=1 Tax=Effusibacillus dendaii TaxID=2743772 RepID=A0A7I8DEG1_9BACL|nr:hypothetical protein [Effusibacillus dendaii]BCJ86930.1 hypothetical protein skT53_19150 [Effusibacillus dendaii]
MYYWLQWPYRTTPFYTEYPNFYSPYVQEVDNLKQRMDQLVKEWDEFRGQITEWRSQTRSEETRHQEVEREFIQELKDQINFLRSDQLAAYEQLLSRFLSNEMNNRNRGIQRDITPVAGMASGHSNELYGETGLTRESSSLQLIP